MIALPTNFRKDQSIGAVLKNLVPLESVISYSQRDLIPLNLAGFLYD